MESGNRIESYVRGAGVAAGIALVAVVVLAFRVPDGTGTLGADVVFAASPTGELGVSRSGPFMSATGLRPGRAFEGRFDVANQTGKRLAVRLRALPDSRDLDRLLVVHVTADHAKHPIYSGRLGGLRERTRPFRIESGRARKLRVRASLPAGLRGGYAGRIETIGLELSSTVEGTSG
jgi:hypothetical protein